MYVWARDTSRAQWVMGMMGGWYVMGPVSRNLNYSLVVGCAHWYRWTTTGTVYVFMIITIASAN